MTENQFHVETAANSWESQRAYSKEIFEALKAAETPYKKLVIYPFVCKDVRGSGTGLAYKYVRA